MAYWRRKWQPTPGFLLGEFHGQWSWAGYCPWDRKELDTSERLNNTAPRPSCALAEVCRHLKVVVLLFLTLLHCFYLL